MTPSEYNSVYEDPSPFVPAKKELAPKNAFFDKVGNFLSKAADTALDVYTVQQQNKSRKIVGSVYPSGQSDPSAATPPAPVPFNWKPLAIGGGALVAVVALVLVLKNNK